MCEKCDNLKNVPKDRKAWTILGDYTDETNEVIAEYGIKLKDYSSEMVLTHIDNGTPIAYFLFHFHFGECSDRRLSDRMFGDGFIIQYCPFCGRKLY